MKTKVLQTRKFFFTLCVLVCMLGVNENAWAGDQPGVGSHYISATTADPAKGLVYISKSNESSVADNKFKNYQPGGSLVGSDKNNTDEVNACYMNNGDKGCTPTNCFFWARPSRGWEFNGSWGTRGTDYAAHPASTGAMGNACNTADELNTGPFDGTDIIQTTAGGGAATWRRPIAGFKAATKYSITYIKPVGGYYSVHYSYTESYDTGETEAGGNAVWKFRTATEDYPTASTWEANEVVDSYAADNITLTVPTETTNFIGWYENDGETPIETNKSFQYTAHGNVTIEAKFKEIGWGDVSGDLALNVTAQGTYGGKMVYVACPTLIGSWSSADFTISPKVAGDANDASNEFGSIEFGAITLNTAESRLEIPYTYVASGWGGISVDVTVTPAYGEPKQFTIACSAEEIVDYEACVEENEVRTHTGTLAEMIAQANSMDNKPTLKLMQNKTVTAPLSFTQSFTFDVNGKVLTANCASAFSIDAAGKDVKIIDGSFTQVGEIHTSHASSGVVSVVTFTQAAKLTMQGGTLSVENTGSGSAYGVNVCNGSIFYMSNGQLTVSAATGNAQGVHVATAGDYATFNGGSLTVSAPTNAYGLWSVGQSNITDATINVETTTGANAYGAYINGNDGVTTITTSTITATAATTSAYGAYVNAGRLNGNGGSFTVSAVTSDVYGVHVASGATAMLQMKAVITAEATGVSGTNVFGVNNQGTVSLSNTTITINSPTTNATAVNTGSTAVSTTIENGTHRANAGGNTAHALHHQHGALNVDGGTFRAIGSGNEVYGALITDDATITNATLHGETQGEGNMAYGFKGDGTGKNILLSGCTIEGISNTSKAYAIYSNANVSATGCTLTATAKGTSEAYGVFAESGTNEISGCNATVSANTVKAYGVNHVAGALTVNGGQYDIEAKQATALSAQNTELYGIANAAGKTLTVSGATFNVIASNAAYSQNVYGAQINGTLISTNSTYYTQGKLNVYGVWGNTASALKMENNTITSRATNGTVSYGIYAKKNFTIDGDNVNAIGSSTSVYAMFFDASTSNGDVLSGKFSTTTNAANTYGALNDAGTAGNVRLKGGIYKATVNLQKYVASGYQIYHLDDTHPDYADGYRYTIATSNPSPYVCRIVGGAYYATLEAAMQYTLDNNGNNWTIVMTQPYTLPAGDYTLPSNATLIIPYKFDQTTITKESNPAYPDMRTTVGLKENFLSLTMADGVHLNVNGKIGVGGELYCQESGKTSYINGPYGRIHMESGSLIQLNSGAYLYAWGMVTGDGNIIVKNNAEVHEMFQVADMKAASNLFNGYNGNSQKYFPITQYSIQNIEVPTTYYYNSRLVGAMMCYYSGQSVFYGERELRLVGTENALFNVTADDESTWVRKSYKNATQVWDINSAAELGSIAIAIHIPMLGDVSFNSADYILPITHNMKIHVLDGDFAITFETELLPGASIEIDKTASLTINETYKNSSNQTKNLSMYVFDQHQWTSASYADAAINVHGTINVLGKLYTTKSIAGGTNTTYGANIFSTNADAGTVFFENTAPSETATIDLITGITDKKPVTKTVTMDPALLKNGTGSANPFTPTSGTLNGHSFAYMNNVWTPTYTNGCFEVVGEKVYAKPSGYVQLKKTQETAYGLEGVEEENHTYLTIDDKLLVLMLGCQWWEVEATSDPTVFECKKEGYEGFYYYDESDEIWKLKTVNVKFYSKEEGEGDVVLHTIVTDFNGRPDQAVIPSNPTKATTTGFTYQFYGWKSSVTGTTYKWTDPLEVATTDMSYRPVFTETKRNYTVTFVDANNGANVPVETPYGDHPSCEPIKDATAEYTYYFLNWTDASSNTYAIDAVLPAVEGPATYTAHWSGIKNKYTITWKDGENVLATQTQQEYGAHTAFPGGSLPTKATDNNFVYAFSGWRSSLTGQTYANGSTPNVAGETTYEAQYSTTPRYMITFNNYNGVELQKEPVTTGETPIYNGVTPARVRDLDGYYVFTGWKNTNGDFFAKGATLPAVSGKETYTAQYSYTNDLFLITLNNVDGNGASWSGKFGEGSTPFYNPNGDDVPVIPEKEGNAQYSYPFTGWTPALQPVSGEATYTAQFGQQINSYTITFANLDGNGKEREVTVEYGQIPVCPETPEKADNYFTYDFLGWAEGSIAAVTGEATYTAQFSGTGTPRTFSITFDGDNGQAPEVLLVAYGQIPAPTTPTKNQDATFSYTFKQWNPAVTAVTGEATYTAQYTQTLRTYTVRFINYDGTELQSSTMAYGATPTPPSNPTKPVNMEAMKAYTFSGWSPTITTVSDEVTYTAQYNEVDLVASVTTASNETFYYGSWSSALSAANSSANSTLRLYQNVTAPVLTKIDQNMTIDLNGCTLSCTTSSTSDNRFIWVNKVALIIDDSKGGGKIYFEGTGNKNYNAIRVDGVGSLTVKGGTIQAHATNNNSSSAAYAVLLYNNSTTQGTTLNMYGGELIASHTQSARTASSVYFNGTNYVNVYGGKLKGKNSIFNNNNTANRIVLRGGYYSMDPGTTLTIPSGYAKVATTEIAGYTYKVAPVVYTITLNKGTHGRADGSATIDFSATELKSFTAVTSAGYDCSGYFDGELQVLNADGTFAAENVSGYITGGKWSKAANSTLTAKWNLSSILEANNNDNIPVSEDAVVDEVIIHDGGRVDIETGMTLTTTNLILEAANSTSGQLVAEGNANINVTGKVYFDLILNTEARHWHAFGVPWNVDVTEYPAIELETGRTLTIGRDYEIVSYNGATRAAQGAGAHCWDYLKHYSGDGHVDVMTPGKGYMIAFTSAVQTVRLTKASGAPIFFDGSNSVTGGSGEDGGWNAIANPMAYHATLNAGPMVGYVHDGGEIGSDGYAPYDINGKKYIVGKMVYVQAASDQTIVVNPAGEAGDMTIVAAPKRRTKATSKQYLSLSDYYAVSLSNGENASKVYVLPEEDKTDEYVIGHDLSQFSMSAQKPQVWVDRYDTKLALNTTAPVNGVADFPLSLYAPVTSDYTLANTFVPDEDYTVYLTLNGEAIWNLSEASYTTTLNNGTTNGYGLRLSLKAPQVTTAIDEAVVDAKGETRKVLMNDKVYIIRGENVYSVDGQLVK